MIKGFHEYIFQRGWFGPFSNLVQEIGKIVFDINQTGTSILLVEQNARLALSYAHRGYVLETGTIVLHGSAKELLKSEHVKRAYLGQ